MPEDAPRDDIDDGGDRPLLTSRETLDRSLSREAFAEAMAGE